MSKFGHSHDYEGLHAFVLIDHVDPGVRPADVVQRMFDELDGESGRVLWASTFVGDYLAFAHVQIDNDEDDGLNLAGLQDFIENDLFNIGVHCNWLTEIARAINKVGIKRDTPEIIALVGMKVERGRAFAIADRLEGDDEHPGIPGFNGASVVLGPLDVVLQLGGDTVEEVLDHIKGMQDMDGLEGILSTTTAITDGKRGPFAGKKHPKKNAKKGAKNSA